MSLLSSLSSRIRSLSAPLFDTHCHLDMIAQRLISEHPAYRHEDDALEALETSLTTAGVCGVVCVATNELDSLTHLARARRYPWVYTTIGVHPCDCTGSWQEHILHLRTLIREQVRADSFSKVVAIGEIGLDFYHPGFDKEAQRALFTAQLELALELSLPVVIHTRNAFDETMQILHTYKHENIRGVIHCFSETLQAAHHVLDLGFKLGIGGPVTYPKNDALRAVIKEVPLSSLLLETDAPFLPPQSIRGKTNTPAHVKDVAHALAAERGESFEDIAHATTQNALDLFFKGDN